MLTRGRQGLTLVLFSAQRDPCLSLKRLTFTAYPPKSAYVEPKIGRVHWFHFPAQPEPFSHCVSPQNKKLISVCPWRAAYTKQSNTEVVDKRNLRKGGQPETRGSDDEDSDFE